MLSAWFDWLEVNKKALGAWYSRLYNQGKDADCNTALKILGNSMWMFNMAANCGVGAGIGPKGFDLQYLHNDLDRKSTVRLLTIISACMNLQYLPKDVITQEIPVISSKKFSLKLWTQR